MCAVAALSVCVKTANALAQATLAVVKPAAAQEPRTAPAVKANLQMQQPKRLAAQERQTVLAVKVNHPMQQTKLLAAAALSVCVRTANALAQATLALARTVAAPEQRTAIVARDKLISQLNKH